MGICQSSLPKINGIIDNQSSYEIIYHVSGSMQEITDYEESLNVGPKLGVGFNKIQAQAIVFNKKKVTKCQKYYSQARIPKHSYCSAGLNNIQIGCFLSIYAAKQATKDKQMYKKLIFKDICIRSNQDACLRINKDLTIKPLSQKQIIQLKNKLQVAGSKILQTNNEQNDVSIEKSDKISQKTQKTQRLLVNTEYLKKVFGSDYTDYYIRDDLTGLYDLNHTDIKINMKQFLKYDWVYLQTLQLDGSGIDDNSWYLFVYNARYYFPNLKNLYLADNKIETLLEGDLQQFPSLKIVQLDYSDMLGVNPLSQDSKMYLLKFALQHPEVLIYCGNIDEKKYLNMINQQKYPQNPQKMPKQKQKVLKHQPIGPPPSTSAPNWDWFLIMPPSINQSRNNNSKMRVSNKNNQQNQTKCETWSDLNRNI